MLRFVAGTIALLYAFAVFGQNQADTIKVYFDVLCDEYPPRHGGATDIEWFIEKIDSANSVGAIERIEVYGYASPEGSEKLNQRLSDRRCRNVANYIIARTGVDPDKVIVRGMGEAWDELRALVEATPGVPYRSKVLDIIDNTPEWIFDAKGRIIGGRKMRLMNLAGGRPYMWLLANIFPKLRYALTVSVQYAPVAKAPAPADTVSVIKPVTLDPVTVEMRPDDHAAVAEGITEDVSAVLAEPRSEHFTGVSEQPEVRDPLYRLAIKTNLLYYGILLPNLEVEWRINNEWSVALEGDVAWWGKYSDNKSYRLAIVSPEVKRWIRPRAPWHGFYVGAFAGAGLYDFEKSTRGYRGEGAMAGLSVGFMWPISRCLSLEAALGAGYLYTRYKKYVPIDGHHVYRLTKDLNYFGPLKLKFSFVWRLWDTNKRVVKNPKTVSEYEK